jgi:protein tyrosine/serine phosphatase
MATNDVSVVEPSGARLKAWRSIRRAATASGIAFCIIAGTIGIYCGVLQLVGNIHVVVEHQFYRSAQLDKVTLARVIQEDGIKSILNLLGARPDEDWYRDEIAVSKARGIDHHDYGIGASNVVSPDQIDELLKIVRDAPKPILVHCKNGADRSGLVAALYLAKVQGVTVEEAAGQLSLYYGHFPWLISNTGAMDESFRIYVQRSPKF